MVFYKEEREIREGSACEWFFYNRDGL